MTDEDRDHLIGNMTSHLCKAQKRIQLRQTAIFCKADPDCGWRVAEGLAGMSQEKRAQATAR